MFPGKFCKVCVVSHATICHVLLVLFRLEMTVPVNWDRLVGLVVKGSASRAKDPGFDSRLSVGLIFPGRVISAISKLALQRPPYHAPDVTWSALVLVGPVSTYCDW